jgi:hypothetical protein
VLNFSYTKWLASCGFLACWFWDSGIGREREQDTRLPRLPPAHSPRPTSFVPGALRECTVTPAPPFLYPPYQRHLTRRHTDCGLCPSWQRPPPPSPPPPPPLPTSFTMACAPMQSIYTSVHPNTMITDAPAPLLRYRVCSKRSSHTIDAWMLYLDVPALSVFPFPFPARVLRLAFLPHWHFPVLQPPSPLPPSP